MLFAALSWIEGFGNPLVLLEGSKSGPLMGPCPRLPCLLCSKWALIGIWHVVGRTKGPCSDPRELDHQ